MLEVREGFHAHWAGTYESVCIGRARSAERCLVLGHCGLDVFNWSFHNKNGFVTYGGFPIDVNTVIYYGNPLIDNQDLSDFKTL